jgi:hypothetical protein
VLTTSGARPIPVEPIIVEELEVDSTRRWLQVALLLLLLGTLVFSGYWLKTQQSSSNDAPAPVELEGEDSHAE